MNHPHHPASIRSAKTEVPVFAGASFNINAIPGSQISEIYNQQLLAQPLLGKSETDLLKLKLEKEDS